MDSERVIRLTVLFHRRKSLFLLWDTSGAAVREHVDVPVYKIYEPRWMHACVNFVFPMIFFFQNAADTILQYIYILKIFLD